jgi:hypothetical protein
MWGEINKPKLNIINFNYLSDFVAEGEEPGSNFSHVAHSSLWRAGGLRVRASNGSVLAHPRLEGPPLAVRPSWTARRAVKALSVRQRWLCSKAGTGISTSHVPTFGPLSQSSELRDRTFPIPNCFEPGGRSAKMPTAFFQLRADEKQITTRMIRLSVGGPNVGNLRWNSAVGHPLSNDPRMAAASDG